MKNKTLLIIIISTIVVFIITAIVLTGVIINKAINNKQERENDLDQRKQEAVEEFDNKIASRSTKVADNYSYYNVTNDTGNEIEYVNNITNQNVGVFTTNSTPTLNETAGWKQTIKGYKVEGKMEIPNIQLSIAVLDRASKEALDISAGVVYGPGFNKIGNTIIMGNSYNNGDVFYNIADIELGDAIYITDSNTGTRIRYVVYNKYIASSTSFDYASRDTGGKREITLISSVNDNNRLIIWAKEEQ